MGDGGVACASLQHLMEQFPVPEALCGANGKFSFKSEKKMRREDEEHEKDEREKNKDSEKGDSLHGRRQREDESKLLRRKELKKVEHRKEELEKGEFVPDGPSREELGKGEFVLKNCQKDELSKGWLLPDKWGKREVENGELGAEKGKKGDLEIVPDKRRKGVRERSPENHRRKGSGRYDNDNQKRGSSKREGSSRERELKNSSRAADEDPGMSKHEHHNGKTHDKDHNSGVLPRRHFSIRSRIATAVVSTQESSRTIRFLRVVEFQRMGTSILTLKDLGVAILLQHQGLHRLAGVFQQRIMIPLFHLEVVMTLKN